MKPPKILADLISSASGAKTHYDVWWAQVSDAKPQYVGVMNEHNDFFRASQDAHYTACFIYLAHVFDKRSDSSSLPTYLAAIRSSTDPAKFQDIESRFSALALRAAPLVTVRHKLVAHVDAGLSEKDVFGPLKITWNHIRSIIYDTAAFVEELAGAPHQGAVGIPRDGRLGEATLKLLRSIKMSRRCPTRQSRGTAKKLTLLGSLHASRSGYP
ncbi:hypothetical protein [Accumulibacter sp.]|uniref:AbiU2 domain-containing protein n=1 Tax=Accumulibacter sp. TaxID=2053492 RepID=UPI00257F53F2|nr:hypothetical protein [Accumulibacter sp.]